MSELVANCPRCGAKEMTFDLLWQIPTNITYDWKHHCEAFCLCRQCKRSTVFILSQRDYGKDEQFAKLSSYAAAVNRIAEIEGYICLKDIASKKPPEYLPANVESAFREGAACSSIGCHNAAGTMFRLCIDLATRPMLPEGETEGLNAKTRRDLGLRLPWLFNNNSLPETLRELSSCIKDDGNDGAHQGTLTEDDAQDILDFTYVLLERIYTEPKRLELARERREARRATKE
jgi:hypothetical protein